MARVVFSILVLLILSFPALAQDAYPDPWFNARFDFTVEDLPKGLRLLKSKDTYSGIDLNNFYYYNESEYPVYTFDPCWQATQRPRYKAVHLTHLRNFIDSSWPEDQRPLYKFVSGKIYKFAPERGAWPLQPVGLTREQFEAYWHEISPQELGTAISYDLYKHVFRNLYKLEQKPMGQAIPDSELFGLPYFHKGQVKLQKTKVFYRDNPAYQFSNREVLKTEAQGSCWVSLTYKPIVPSPQELYRTATKNIMKRVGQKEAEKILSCYAKTTGLSTLEQVLELELVYLGDPETPEERIQSLHGAAAVKSIRKYCRKLFDASIWAIAKDEHAIPTPPKIMEPDLNYSSLETAKLYERFYALMTRHEESLTPLASCLSLNGIAVSAPLSAVAYYWGSPEVNAFVPIEVLDQRAKNPALPAALRSCRTVIETLEPIFLSSFAEALGHQLRWQE